MRTGAASIRAHRVARDAVLVSTGAILIVLAWEVAILAPAIRPGAIGVDLHLYQDAARSWLSGDGFYHARQLAGHYAIAGADIPGGGDILYPPVVLWLLVPFTILPDFLWWAIPAGAIGWSLWRLRPAIWTLPVAALCLAWPGTIGLVVHGNPVLWAGAGLAVGCVVTGPAVLVLIKPSLFPFAFVGANRRRWWIALGLFALACLPFGALWADWIRTLTNSSGSLLYSLHDVPLLALALVAWAGRYQPPAISAAKVT